MKYKIAICDDSGADRQFVLNMVRAWASSAGHTVHIDDFPSAESFLFRYAEESDYDILLLDIEMGAMDGVTMAKELRKSNDTGRSFSSPATPIIFQRATRWRRSTI